MIIKRITQGQYGVAEWFYDFFEAGMGVIKNFNPASDNEKSKRLSILDIILNTLHELHLFTLTDIEISYFNQPTKHDTTEENIKVITPEIIDIKKLLLQHSNINHLLPIKDLYLIGSSEVFQESEHKTSKGIFTIQFSYEGIRIITDADIWLPYNLLAKPQPEIYQLNAPRLKNALEKIEQLTGIEPVYDNTKYARVNKYELENRMDDEDQPEEVIERQYLRDV
ncbi:hypothetical protein [Microscilla marina]|uniref:Uncharacterized protein n=1 Tax=Microscilla marina ATCC 23134 TaxID=313606 RepID=A1ZMG4_MICM2|nr:hypothetical protein [Microscilla marina]EAY28344.1 hypothetical protein M23134_03896 [Microscilla marina ATCC 23134]